MCRIRRQAPASEARAEPARGPLHRGKPEEVARTYIGVGRMGGIRPADLVGAVANEARISSREIGAIDIADRFSIVEVPAAAADGVIAALRGTTIRGKKVVVRFDHKR